jgi:hypothetical protein
MALRASTIGKRISWASLPAEIRLMILEAIAQQKHPAGLLWPQCAENGNSSLRSGTFIS